MLLVVGASLLTILGFISPISASSRSTGQKIVRGGTVTLSNASTWTTIDPGNAGASQAFTSEAGQFIYGHLFTLGSNGQLLPQLALGSTFSHDGTIETLDLRPGVKFSDGTPFDAQAVVYNITRDLSSSGVGPGSFVALLSDVKSVNAQGKTKVVFHLQHRDFLLDQAFAVSLAGEIVSPTAVAREGLTNFQLMPVGAGAFMVQSDQPGSVLTLVKNPRYFMRGQPYLNGINITVVGSVQAGYAGVASGSLSAYAITSFQPATYVQQAASNPAIKILKTPDITDSHLQLNIDKPPFDNPLAVKAFDEATERLALIDDVLPGTGSVPDWTFQSPGGLYYTKDVPFPGQPAYNLAQAQADVKTLGGLSFGIMAAATDSQTVEIQTALQKQWQLAGMTVNVQVIPHPTEILDQEAGTYNVIEGGGQVYLNPYFASYLFITSTAPNNAFGFKSSKVDGLLTRVEETPTTATATLKKLWYQIDTIEADEGAFQGLFNGPTDIIEQKNLEGMTVNGSLYYLESAWLS
jgi:peptide/nickel transport system substrate-binding protein